MTRWKNKMRRLSGAAGALVMAISLLTACSMDRDTFTAGKRVRLVPGDYSVNVDTAVLDDAALRAVGDHYRHYGEGTVDLVVTYDPKSRTNTAMKATNEAARIAGSLRKSGVSNYTTDIMPVTGGDSRTMIDFRTVTAEAPRDCPSMGGLDGRATEADFDYRYGCTIEAQLARQIARPQDLAGRDGLDAGSGRRQANIVEGYKTGEPNAVLEGESTQE